MSDQGVEPVGSTKQPGRIDQFFRESVVPRGTGRHAPRMLKPAAALGGLAAGGVLAMWVLFAALARLIGQDVSWFWPLNGSISEDVLFDLVRSTATLFALFGGSFAVLYAYRKQRVEEAAGHRADSEALSKRYQEAATQIGSDNAAVRLAGIYAMARLANDWPEQRQTCVDVLCAYVRLHSTIKPVDGDERETQTVRCVMDIVAARVEFEAKPSWSACDFDLSGAVLHGFSFDDSVFEGFLNLRGATFTGDCEFFEPYFAAGVDLSNSIVGDDSGDSSSLWFEGGRNVEAGFHDHVRVRKNSRLFYYVDNGGEEAIDLSFENTKIEGSFAVSVHKQAMTAGLIGLRSIELTSGASLSIELSDKDSPGAYLPRVELNFSKIGPDSSVLVNKQLIDDTARDGLEGRCKLTVTE